MTQYLSEEARKHVLWFYGEQCHYCRIGLTIHSAEIDHLIPVSRGGETVLQNLRPSCQPCNREKSDKTESEYLSYRRIQAALQWLRKQN